MPVNSRTTEITPYHSILSLGEAGSGKTAQIATLLGKKFVYAFDPGTLRFLSTYKIDADVEEFLPDIATVDFSLKGFNKGSRDDKPARKKSPEPRCYVDWEDHFNEWSDNGSFDSYDWLIFDSLTLFSHAMGNRLSFLNGRFGGIPELSDYRVIGNKLAQSFTAITSMRKNLYVTGHVQTFQDEKTQRISTEIGVPGGAKAMLPKLFSNIWLLEAGEKRTYKMRTTPDTRGLKTIRSIIPGLAEIEDITIRDWRAPENYGIGAILRGVKLQAVNGPKPVAALPPGPKSSLPATPINKPDPGEQGNVAK